MNTGVGATRKLAEFAATAAYDDLPLQVVEDTKRVILDTIGCTLGAHSTEIGYMNRKLAACIGGVADCHVIGTGQKTSCASAAFANANMANALDYDETFLNCAHIAAQVLWAAIPLAERQESTGKDLIAATTIGYEIAARICASTEWYIRVDGSELKRLPVTGYSYNAIGSAVAAGKILNLGVQQMVDAIGLAGVFAPMPSTGMWANQAEALPLIKYFPAGWAAQAGVTAALLAEMGYTGLATILDGEKGFCKMMGFNECDFDFMLGELRKKWWVSEASFKPWPCCRHIQSSLTVFSNLVDRYSLKPQEIDEVKIKGSIMYGAYFWVAQPKGLVSMEFSAPHAIANVAFRVPPGPQWLYRENEDTPQMREFRSKVKFENDPKVVEVVSNQIGGKCPKRVRRVPTTVEVKARGAVFKASTEFAKGDPWDKQTVMSGEELKSKFRGNAAELLGRYSVGLEKTENAIKAIEELETLSNTADLVNLLCP